MRPSLCKTKGLREPAGACCAVGKLCAESPALPPSTAVLHTPRSQNLSWLFIIALCLPMPTLCGLHCMQNTMLSAVGCWVTPLCSVHWLPHCIPLVSKVVTLLPLGGSNSCAVYFIRSRALVYPVLWDPLGRTVLCEREQTLFFLILLSSAISRVVGHFLPLHRILIMTFFSFFVSPL